MFSPIPVPCGINVYTDRAEIINFFNQQLKNRVTINFSQSLQLSELEIQKNCRNSIYIDPKVFASESLKREFFSRSDLPENVHFVMLHEDVLNFLLKTGLSENSVISIPCDYDVFTLQDKKPFEVKTETCSNVLESEKSLLSEITGRSDFTSQLKTQLLLAAKSELPVLFLGESGTGKSYAASFIHKLSKRKNGAFNVLDMGTLTDSLADTQLFGSVKGAFTGAVNSDGLLSLSNDGTLFLDEIANASLSIQAKLLRFLETGKFRAVGETKEKRVDSRLIFATNENLCSMIKKKEFRADLYNRINIFTINLVPLRERTEDIEPIARHFLKKQAFSITESALSLLESYSWPGNIRQLKNCLLKAMIFSQNNCIQVKDISFC